LAEVDPVILELRAELGRYKAELRSTTTSVEQLLGRQEKSAKRLEAEMRRSSGAIGSTLKGLAGTLAAAFTGRELVGLIDGFTRFQNQLKVAGLEGEQLAQVQERLRQTGAQYGVELESLGSSFSRMAQVQKDLGASTEDLLRLNEIVAASLKVAGTDAQSASGALLQLAQALGSGVVRAEEFNSVLEGALPLAQAAARGIEGMGGSVAKLRAEVAEGNVTSQQFFEGVLRGGVQTLADAENATLTLGGAFTTLRNELTLYFGEAGGASGATEALAGAIKALADNLDILIPALAVLGTAIGGRLLAASLVGGRGLQTVAAYASVATTSLAGTALAAQSAGAALLSALGGPVGLAITAVTLSLGYLATATETAEGAVERLGSETDKLRSSSEELRARLQQAGVAVDDIGTAARSSADKLGEMNNAMSLSIGLALDMARAFQKVSLLQGDLAELRATRERIENPNVLDGPGALGTLVRNQFGGNDALIRELRKKEIALEENIALQVRALENGIKPTPTEGGGGAPPAAPPPKPAGGRTRTRSGPDADEIAARQEAEIARLRAEEIQARLNLTEDIDERANLQAELDSIEFAQRRADIESNADLSRAQKDAQLEILGGLFGVSGEIDEQGRIIVRGNEGLYAQIREREAQLEEIRRQGQLDADTARAKEDVLRSQLSITSNREDRARLEKQILDIQIQAAKDHLREQIATAELAKGQEKRVALLKQQLADLDGIAANESKAIEEAYESPLQRYARDLNEKSLEDRAEELIVDEIETVRRGMRDAIADAIGTDDPLITGLLDILLQEVLFKPLADSLANARGGGGDFFGSLLSGIGSFFGGARATGGPVSAGKAYLVGERGPELMVPGASGTVIPNHAISAANSPLRGGGAASGGVVKLVIEEGPQFASRVRAEATGVAVEVTRATAPRLIDAAANETARRFSRPKL
jgi:tape measure domain-containing protein